MRQRSTDFPSPTRTTPHPRARRAWSSIAALWLCCITSPLAAAPSASERETARALMGEGDRLVDQGEYQRALQSYVSAHAIMNVPTTGLAVARMQAKLGRLVEARATAIEVVNAAPQPGEPPIFSEARQAANALLTELEPRVPSLRTEVVPAEAAYAVSVDGVAIPSAARGAPYRTDPGVHAVRVEAPGFAPQSLQVELAEGQSRTLTVTLQAERALAPQQVAAAEAQGGARDALSGPVDASDPARAGRTRAIIGFSVGGAALVVGAIAGIMSSAKTSDLKDACPGNVCPPAQRSALSSASTLANVANVALPLGIIGVGYGVYEMLTLPSARPPRAERGRVHLALNGTGLMIGGSL